MTIAGHAIDGALIIPLYDAASTLTTLEFILGDGQKVFLPGGRKHGCFYTIGTIDESTLTICIVEGFATGASIYESTGLPVVVAFDAGNLVPAAEAIHAKYPAVHIRACGDHDMNNTGQSKAQEAAYAVNGSVVIPPTPGTDWNDVYVNDGAEAVRAAILPSRNEADETSKNTSAHDLEDPEPILLDENDIPEVSPGILPVQWLRDFIAAVARSTETPSELSLLMCLAVIATTVQRRLAIEVEPGYTEPLNIMAMPALGSGNRKTKVVTETTAPLLEFERELAADQAEIIVRAAQERRLTEDRIKHLRQKAARAKASDLETLKDDLFAEEAKLKDVPVQRRLWCQDVTIEKLGSLMAEQSEAMSIISDEGGFFDILAGRYSPSGAPNLDLVLQGHAGAPFRVDRGSRPSVFMESPALTLALSPQPEVIKGLASQPGFRGRGLIARQLIMLPKSRLGRRTLQTVPIPGEIKASYHRHVTALLKRPPRLDGKPYLLQLSPDAHKAWKGFQRRVEDELRDGGMFEHMRDWASKLPGAVARITGLIHCATYADGSPQLQHVELPSMEAALSLGDLLGRHAVAAFSLMGSDSKMEAARKSGPGWSGIRP